MCVKRKNQHNNYIGSENAYIDSLYILNSQSILLQGIHEAFGVRCALSAASSNKDDGIINNQPFFSQATSRKRMLSNPEIIAHYARPAHKRTHARTYGRTELNETLRIRTGR